MTYRTIWNSKLISDSVIAVRQVGKGNVETKPLVAGVKGMILLAWAAAGQA